MNVLLARSQVGMEQTAAVFERAGLKVIRAAVTEIRPPADWTLVDECLRRADSFDAWACTSMNGIHMLERRLTELDPDRSIAAWRIPIFVVGEASAAQVRQSGFVPVLPPRVIDARTLAAEMRRALQPGARILHVRGDLADETLRTGLESGGLVVEDAIVYHTAFVSKDEQEKIASLCADVQVDAIVFFSPSSVDGLIATMGASWVRGKIIASLGQRTSAALEPLGLRPSFVPSKPSIEIVAEYLATRAAVHPGKAST